MTQRVGARDGGVPSASPLLDVRRLVIFGISAAIAGGDGKEDACIRSVRDRVVQTLPMP